MRGIGVVELGGPDALQIVDLSEGHAGPSEVRVRVQAATVIPPISGLRNGSRAEALRGVLTPQVPGTDVAGVVEEVRSPPAPGPSEMATRPRAGSFIAPQEIAWTAPALSSLAANRETARRID